LIEGGWNNTANNYTDSNETSTLGIKYTSADGCSLEVGLYCKHGKTEAIQGDLQ